MTTPTCLIFAVTYVAMVVGRPPALRTDRSGIALIAVVLPFALTEAAIDRQESA